MGKGRNSRVDRDMRTLNKLIAAGEVDLVIAIQRGDLTAERAYEKHLARHREQSARQR